MLGRIRWGSGRKIVFGAERMLDLSVLTVALPQRARRPERAVRKGISLFLKHRVKYVLTPSDFPWWSILIELGLRPVDTIPLRCALTPVWVTAQLKRRGITQEQAILRLKGERWEPALEGLARDLCPIVRRLVFDVPGGEAVANRLRCEMGLPVLPGHITNVHLTLWLNDGPVLTGAEFTLPGRELPADCDRLPMISVLWEAGRIKTEEIVLKI